MKVSKELITAMILLTALAGPVFAHAVELPHVNERRLWDLMSPPGFANFFGRGECLVAVGKTQPFIYFDGELLSFPVRLPYGALPLKKGWNYTYEAHVDVGNNLTKVNVIQFQYDGANLYILYYGDACASGAYQPNSGSRCRPMADRKEPDLTIGIAVDPRLRAPTHMTVYYDGQVQENCPSLSLTGHYP